MMVGMTESMSISFPCAGWLRRFQAAASTWPRVMPISASILSDRTLGGVWFRLDVTFGEDGAHGKLKPGFGCGLQECVP